MCCSVLQCDAGVGSCNKVQAHNESTRRILLQYAAACCSVCSVLQCVAARRSMLQWVAVHCSVLQCEEQAKNENTAIWADEE